MSVLGGPVRLLSLFGVRLCGLLLGCLPWTRVEALNLPRYRGSGEIDDDRLQFMARKDAAALDESLDTDDVSCAGLVWSTALADAYRFAGSP